MSYRNTGSPLHAVHPLVFVCWTVALVAAALVDNHPAYLLALAVATLVVALAARVARPWWSVVCFTVWMGLAIILINAVVGSEGAHVLVRVDVRLPLVGMPQVTLESLAFGAAMALRLAVIVSAFALLNLCVHPDDLLRAAVKLRLPYKSVLVTSLSTRFMPVLMEDAATIVDVQRSRGLEFDSGGLGARVRNRSALILPLLSNSLDRAVQLAEAMESRAYGAASRRTFLHDARVDSSDRAALALLVAFIAATVWLRASGVSAYDYYPGLSSLVPDHASLAGLGVSFVLAVSIVPLSFLRRRHRT